MGFLALWPLAFLLLVPIIILLYILRQEAKKQQFSSTMLWKEVFQSTTATKPWEKLKKSLLLVLQILSILLLILALMGPWLLSKNGEKQQAVLVLDNSASMGAEYEDGESRLDAAKEAACNYVDSLPADSVIHVISADKQAVLVLSNSTDKLEAKNRIRSLEQTCLAGDLSVSLGLVQSCASQSEDADIVFFTDTAFDMGDLQASVESFYSENTNLSVDSISTAWKEDQLQVMVLVSNYSKENVPTEINLYGQDEAGREELLDIAQADAVAGESTPVYLELSGEKTKKFTLLRAELNDADALEADNTAWCVLAEEHTNRVLLLSKSNLFIEKAIENLVGMEVYRTDEKEVVNGENLYDLYIFDGIVPEQLPEQGSFLFVNCSDENYFSKEQQKKNTRLTLGTSDVTDYIAGTEIGVNTVQTYQLPTWGTGFLTTDNGDTAGFYGVYDGHRIAVLGFDLHDTDFGLCAEFPVLISGLCDYLLSGSLTEKNAYTAGDSILLHGSTRGSDLTLVLPDGEEQILSASEAYGSYVEVAMPGIYKVSQELEDTTQQQQFSVAFPTSLESDVDSAENMTTQGTATAISSHRGVRELRNVLLIVLLLLLIVEWAVYVRQQ